ncbi:transaldolase [Dactylosporangium roseum]|uniref:D,D-heptose 1,7-bisphosphate phosphatase n=1 Tax=Dactylosporangium roseum TaxID=47989 RepID=A0ABY5ZD82_9ACTN|nr:transaldolase [Dactylosporangium roseum]UWZ39827.1 transaldolase [Dactylosporangium roseum]
MSGTTRRPAVFLDRDGVLNEVTVSGGTPLPPPDAAHMRLLPGVVEACRRLHDLGYVLVVVTNQPDLARGKQSAGELDRMHAFLTDRLPLDDIAVCTHDDADDCACRKPRPGLLLDAADRLNLDLTGSFMVGDRWRDVEAAQRAGVTSIYIDRDYGERKAVDADLVASSLLDALPFIESRHVSGGSQPVVGAALKHVKIFADGADLESIVALAGRPDIAGFTTNPTLMRKSGVSDYEPFARKVLEAITDRPVSFEVFADDPDGMIRQARLIASWGRNVYVKIPVTDTRGRSTADVIRQLTADRVQLNVTALLTLPQVEEVTAALDGTRGAVVSVFAGRIADTGRDPVPVMTDALRITSAQANVKLLWASPREILNVRQADDIGVDIITVTHDLLAKLPLFGKSLDDYSLETVRMFHNDAAAAGYTL